MHVTGIKFHGIDMDVHGYPVKSKHAVLTADPANSIPPEGGYIDGMRVMIGDFDVTDILEADALDKIESAALMEIGG